MLVIYLNFVSRYSIISFIFFFFLLTRPPPRSTLFPYTTPSDLTHFPSLSHHDFAAARSRHSNEDKVERQQKDRKSTRLNSSHRCISYAVFCLKKKKNELKAMKKCLINNIHNAVPLLLTKKREIE